jgi:hypothetical protein
MTKMLLSMLALAALSFTPMTLGASSIATALSKCACCKTCVCTDCRCETECCTKCENCCANGCENCCCC